jgi:hypothetical protein
VPDFYAEPGRSPFRDSLYENVTETIDTFTGNLSLSYVDLRIPGNGGLDIEVRRNYNANTVHVPQFQVPKNLVLANRTPFGTGWTMHFGRVLKVFDQERGWTQGCADNGNAGTNYQLDNAVLELPDGSTQTLFPNASSFGGPNLVTKNNWVAYCRADTSIDVVSPEGSKYTMTKQLSGGVEGGGSTVTMHAWYPTRITDRNGNYITIQYLETGSVSTGKEALPQTIVGYHPNGTLDGRSVTFTYAQTTSGDTIRLASVSANGQTVNYFFSTFSGSSRDYKLDRVTLPTGLEWKYTYHSYADQRAGDKLLSRVTYPFDATVSYTYDSECFNASCPNAAPPSFVVASKTNGGRDVAAGIWSFNYNPSGTYPLSCVRGISC